MASAVLTPAGGVLGWSGALPPPRPPSLVVRVQGRSAPPGSLVPSQETPASATTRRAAASTRRRLACTRTRIFSSISASEHSVRPPVVHLSGAAANGALVAEAEMDLELEEGASGDGGRGGGGGRVLVAAPSGDSRRGPRGPLFTLPVHPEREDEEEARNDGDGLLHLGFAFDTEDMDRSDCRPRT
ncbi:hypothetical protein ZWY2020_009548 [Hordeum vulgare]|nr:hypothetical protein ZWY2020_009548 [Hordeum vulgare]